MQVTPLPHDRGTIPCVAFCAIKAGSEKRNVRFHGAPGTSFGKYEHVHGESVNF